MSNKPEARVSHKGWSVNIYRNDNGKLSITAPQKSYDKNQTWKTENKHLAAEWVVSKYIFPNEVAALREFLDKLEAQIASLEGRSSSNSTENDW